ncbi:MAG: hypothetical protein ACYCPM_06335 [Acidobacteriaceae bacterium]
MPQHLYEEKCDELSASSAEWSRFVPRRTHRKLPREHNLQIFSDVVSSIVTSVALDSLQKEISVLPRSAERTVLPGKIQANLKNPSTGRWSGRKLQHGIHRFTDNSASTTNASKDAQ